jgi:hypothetical protein
MLLEVKQDISVLDHTIGLANRFKSEFSGSLKRLHAFSRHNGSPRNLAIGRRLINLGLCIGLPDREYDSGQYSHVFGL